MALCELVPEINLMKGESYDGDDLEASSCILQEMEIPGYGVHSLNRSGQQNMQQMLKHEGTFSSDMAEFSRSHDTDIQLLLDSPASTERCNNNGLNQTLIPDFHSGQYRTKSGPPSQSTASDGFDATASSQESAPSTRRVVGRPHIATINVLRSPIQQTTPTTEVQHSVDKKDVQRVAFQPAPTWSTTKHVMSTSSSTPATAPTAFSTPSFNVRQPLAQVNATFDAGGDGLPSAGYYSSSFSGSNASSSETQRGSSPDYSTVSSFFTSGGFLGDECREASMVAKTPLSPGTEQLPQMDDPVLMQYYIPYMNERENHNIKERHRRSRVAAACNAVRNMIPGLGEKTDKASVFEQAVDYLEFLKSRVGDAYDQDFVDFMEVARQGH